MDRRVTALNGFSNDITPVQLASSACVSRFKPASMKLKPYKITCVQFNETGSEILVNYSEDYLYLFRTSAIDNGEISISSDKVVYEELTKIKRKERTKDNVPISTSSASNFTPPMKRLRLRGDWSDTGPEARPDRENQPNRTTFMNRMSHLFAQWIDESLSTSNDANSPSPSEESASGSDDSGSPRTPTDSLTSAMASCSTTSPQNSHAKETTEACKVKELPLTSLQQSQDTDNQLTTNVSLENLESITSTSLSLSDSHITESDERRSSVRTEDQLANVVQVIEGASDSDDYNDDEYDQDEEGTDWNKDQLYETFPAMVYKGHRNSRTMVTCL